MPRVEELTATVEFVSARVTINADMTASIDSVRMRINGKEIEISL